MYRKEPLVKLGNDFTNRSSWVESPRAWEKLLPQSIPKSVSYPEIPLHVLGRDAAERYPHNLAIYYIEDGRKYTYRELMYFSDKLARGLADLGVKKGDGVGVYMGNSPEFIFSVYGISQVGGIVVPLNPLLSVTDIEYVIRDSGNIKTLICDFQYYPSIESIVKKTGIERVLINGENPDGTLSLQNLIDESPADPPQVDFNPKEDPICLMYTGGTTGAPKGVVQTHFNICTNVLQMVTMEPTSPAEEGVVSCVTILPMCHTFGFSQTQLYIAQKAMMILFNGFDPPRIMSAIEMYKTENFVGIPLMFQVIINDPQFGNFDLSSLVRVVSGAAPLPQDLVTRWKEAVGTDVGQGYGLSEACPSILMRPLWLKQKEGSIGIPLIDTDVKIVDPLNHEKTVPTGEVGEIVARGPQIMKGYWNRPEKTAEVLINGWLHTGDLAYMDEEGYVYIAGRLSDMIKYKGYKVLPDDVEDHLHKHPAILECGVIGVPDKEIGETIKAFVVLKDAYKNKITEQEIIDWSKENMSGYKWPRIVEFIEALPRTAIGKIFRLKLREIKSQE